MQKAESHCYAERCGVETADITHNPSTEGKEEQRLVFTNNINHMLNFKVISHSLITLNFYKWLTNLLLPAHVL